MTWWLTLMVRQGNDKDGWNRNLWVNLFSGSLGVDFMRKQLHIIFLISGRFTREVENRQLMTTQKCLWILMSTNYISCSNYPETNRDTSTCAQMLWYGTRISFMLRVHTMVRFLEDSSLNLSSNCPVLTIDSVSGTFNQVDTFKGVSKNSLVRQYFSNQMQSTSS